MKRLINIRKKLPTNVGKYKKNKINDFLKRATKFKDELSYQILVF